MYNEYFGLKETPFSIAPDPRYLYMSEQHREALAHLVYGINCDGGFVLLTGEVGTGKTTVCRCLLEQMPDNSKIAFILNPKLTAEELLATICDEFGINYPEGNTSIKVFIDLINSYLLDAHTRSYKSVLIIDEAQNLSADVLEQLRLLTNLETNQFKLLQIVLLGQPELKDKLARPELRQLAQRITARYHLGPLSKKDMRAYIAHRLSIAGIKNKLFATSAISKLYSLSKGVPRLINILCDRALLGAYAQGKGYVNKRTLVRAAREVFGQMDIQFQPRTTPAWLVAALLIVFMTALAAVYYNNFYLYETTPVVTESAGPSHSRAVVAQNPANQQIESDPLQWPADQQVSVSKQTAFQTLFRHWDITYLQNEHIDACEQAEVQGLRCLKTRGSLNSLRNLNRPAVLKLFDESGREFYAALTSLTGGLAFFEINAESKKVSIRDLASQWFGDYTILWRTPPEYQGNILPGNEGPEIEWLGQQLALVQGHEAGAEQNRVFGDTLIKQIKEFQLTQGLVPDGIVGAQTLIHLNTVVGVGIPKLTGKQGDE